MSKASMLKDAERGLAIRLKRFYTETPKGGPTGTSVELTGALKDVERATARLDRAKVAHALATAEVAEYADLVSRLGGTPNLPENFSVYELTATEKSAETEDTETDAGADDDTPAEDSEPDNQPEPTSAGNGSDAGSVRIGGRFAKRGAQVG